jgi:hypothetical protein
MVKKYRNNIFMFRGIEYKIIERKNSFTPHITYKKQITKYEKFIFFVKKQINMLATNGNKNANIK